MSGQVVISDYSGKMTEEELNSLIAHAHRRIEQLQRQLAAQQSLERKRVDEALTKQQEEDDTLASQRVSQEKQHWQEELRTLKQEWVRLSGIIKYMAD